MFLDATIRRNSELIETAFQLHQSGLIPPDTFVLDLDLIIYNAKMIKKVADELGIKLYFMTKQFGRNPFISEKLMELGYEGAVCVDFDEVKTLSANGIKLGNIGHIVQIPSRMVHDFVENNPEVITVYSYEKAVEVSRAATSLSKNQGLLLKVIEHEDLLYPGQQGGFYLQELLEMAKKIQSLPGVHIEGLTSFPCFIYNEVSGEIEATPNMNTLKKAKKILEEKLNIKINQMNTPSTNCCQSIKLAAENGSTHCEPGHGLIGTTPMNAFKDGVEVPAIVYVSEVSHNLDGLTYAYGGGYYRRSHVAKALIGESIQSAKCYDVSAMSLESIDYYFPLKGTAMVGNTAVFAFRSQVFVTRSKVAIVKGIHSGKPEICGIYTSLGIRGDGDLNRFAVIVLDSFGIGYMDDVYQVRKQDIGANTFKSILDKQPSLVLINLQKLGIMNALGMETEFMKFNLKATYGVSNLMHIGADTFSGHQEIMGTKPKKPIEEPFSYCIQTVYEALIRAGHKVTFQGEKLKFLVVDKCVTVADNLEADLGQVYNITAALDYISYDKVVNIGKVVRGAVQVARVIAFGGKNVPFEDILYAVEEKEGKYIGINAPKSGVYNDGYQVIHLGYGVESNVQLPTILGKAGVPVVLIGKVADIVANEYGKNIPAVDTEEVMKITLKEFKKMERGFLCTNVQETDLAGHS